MIEAVRSNSCSAFFVQLEIFVKRAQTKHANCLRVALTVDYFTDFSSEIVWNLLSSQPFIQLITYPSWLVTSGTTLLQGHLDRPYMEQVVPVAPLLSLVIRIDCWLLQIGHDVLDRLDSLRLLLIRMPYCSCNLVHNRNSLMRFPFVGCVQLLLGLADSERSD